jgi:capsular exopolysaccharide synthesis family protein
VDFKQFFQVIRRRWLTVVIITAVALAIAGFLSWRTTPQYESKSRIFISVNVADTTDTYSTSFFIAGRVASYADLATSTGLMEQVIDDLDLDSSPTQLASQVSAEVVPETSIIELTVRAEAARDAQAINEWLADRYADYLTQVETPEGQELGQIRATVTDTASFNAEAVTPRTLLNLIAGGVIGALLAIAAGLARDILDRTVRSQGHIQEITSAPVLAGVGFDKDITSTPLLTDLGSFAPRTEAFRLLRTNLQFLDLDHQPRCLVITSAVPAEGKTTTSANLAVALAQTGRRTLLIDGDLRRPRVARLLGLDAAVGLTTVLVGKAEVTDAVQVHEPSGLHFLASGAKPPNPTEILQSQVTSDLIRQLSNEYDMVIIDAPPLLPVADASVLSTVADGTIIVVQHGRTTKDQVAEAIGRLEQVGGRLFGVVVNMIPRRSANYYYYYYEESTGRRKG